jgi:hypothetical protein
MNVVIQNPSAIFAFGNTENESVKTSLSGIGPSVTTKGQKTAGPVELYSSSDRTRKVVRARLGVRVPLFDLSSASDEATASGSLSGKAAVGYAQAELTVTLPNAAGVITVSGDIDSSGVPQTQAAANATAVALGLQVLLNSVCDQGSGVLDTGKSLVDYTLFGTDLSNPITRGLMGQLPVDGTDRSIKRNA